MGRLWVTQGIVKGTVAIASIQASMSAHSIPTSSQSYTKVLACTNCRKGKLKCDRVKPCASCKLRGLQNQCYQSSPTVEGDRGSQSLHNSAVSPAATHSTAGDTIFSSLAEVRATLDGQHQAIASLLSLVGDSSDELSKGHKDMTWHEEVVHHLPSPHNCSVLLEFCYSSVRAERVARFLIYFL